MRHIRQAAKRYKQFSCAVLSSMLALTNLKHRILLLGTICHTTKLFITTNIQHFYQTKNNLKLSTKNVVYLRQLYAMLRFVLQFKFFVFFSFSLGFLFSSNQLLLFIRNSFVVFCIIFQPHTHHN